MRRGKRPEKAARARRPHGRWATAVAAGVLAGLFVATSAVPAQSIEERIGAAPDGEVRMSFAARPGVCGDGEHIIHRSDRGDRGRAWLTHAGKPCEPGPVRVTLEIRDGEIVELDTRVGGRPSHPVGNRAPEGGRAGPTDLGAVPSVEAAAWLLALAREAPEEAGEEAVFAATLADSATVWPELLEIARDDSVAEETREAALFWLGHAAGEAATGGLESIIESETEIEVRETAVFALSQRPEDQAIPALLRVARTHPEPRIRAKAFFWLAEFDDPRVLDLFEEVLTEG